MERVESKYLFNYQLTGVLHPQVEARTEKWMEEMLKNPEARTKWERITSDDPDVDDQEAVDHGRGGIPAVTQYLSTVYKEGKEGKFEI